MDVVVNGVEDKVEEEEEEEEEEDDEDKEEEEEDVEGKDDDDVDGTEAACAMDECELQEWCPSAPVPGGTSARQYAPEPQSQ